MIEIIYFSWELLLPVVQRLDNVIHQINRYLVDKVYDPKCAIYSTSCS